MGIPLGFLLATSSGAKEEKPSRGYLDKGYAYDSLAGRTIQFQGISTANAVLEKTLRVAPRTASTLSMDTLYKVFNARLVQILGQKLAKSRVVLADTAPGAGAILVSKLIGEPAVPDSFLISVPPPPAGSGADISLVVGKAVFGVRSQQVIKYRSSPFSPWPHNPFGPGMPKPKMPSMPRFKQRFYLEDYDPLNQGDPAFLQEEKGRQKRFYTILEFCFYDHRARRAFGYGWDGVETDFRGEVGKLLTGRTVDLEQHMRKQAGNLAGLFLGNASQAGNYRNTEIVLEKQTAPPERIREELEADEEE